MKVKMTFPLLSVGVLVLTSCSGPKAYSSHLEDYVYRMRYHDGFNILQLTDIHWNNNTSSLANEIYLDKLFAEVDAHLKATQGADAKIDLVELTGDQFMLANAYHVDTFVDYFEKQSHAYQFKYAVIWGNHDNHGLYNPNWLSRKFKSATNAIYFDEDDDLYGRSNFVIDLTSDGSSDTSVIWQIANLDSGASFSETAVSPFRDYDYIRKDQVDWWLKEHDRAGESVPSIAYYHIPQDENRKAWEEHEKGGLFKSKFFKLEEFADNGNDEYASDFIDVAKENNLKGAFMGHAHNVDWTYELDGVVIGLGVKTGPELYYAHIDPETDDKAMKEGLESVGINEKFDLIGASLVTLKNDEGTFDLEHLYFNERASGDFAKWVKW